MKTLSCKVVVGTGFVCAFKSTRQFHLHDNDNDNDNDKIFADGFDN